MARSFQRATIISAVLCLCVLAFLTGTNHSAFCFQEQGQTHQCTCILRNPAEDTNPGSLLFRAGNTPLDHSPFFSLRTFFMEEARQGFDPAPIAFIKQGLLKLRSVVLLV